MVEVDVGHFVVLGISGEEEHRKRLESGQFEHRDQQRRLVAADAVAAVEGHRNVVRLVAGGLRFGGDAHVADLLGDELEERHDLLLRCAAVPDQFGGFRPDCGGDRVEPRTAHLIIPAGDLLPVLRGAGEQPLDGGVHWRHPRFGNHLRHVPGDPGVEDAAVFAFLLKTHRAGHFILDRLRGQRPAFGRVDPHLIVEEGDIRLQHVVAGPLPRNPRLEGGFPALDVEHVADFEAGDGDGEDFVRRVVDVAPHLGGVDGFVAGGGVDLDDFPVRADDLHGEHFEFLVGGVVAEGEFTQLFPAGFVEHLLVEVVGAGAESVGLIGDLLEVIDEDAVGVGEPFRGGVFRACGDFGDGHRRGRNSGRQGEDQHPHGKLQDMFHRNPPLSGIRFCICSTHKITAFRRK